MPPGRRADFRMDDPLAQACLRLRASQRRLDHHDPAAMGSIPTCPNAHPRFAEQALTKGEPDSGDRSGSILNG